MAAKSIQLYLFSTALMLLFHMYAASHQNTSALCSNEWIPFRVKAIFSAQVNKEWREAFGTAISMFKKLLRRKKRLRDIKVPQACHEQTPKVISHDMTSCVNKDCLRKPFNRCIGRFNDNSYGMAEQYLTECHAYHAGNPKEVFHGGRKSVSNADLAIFVGANSNGCGSGHVVASSATCGLQWSDDFPRCDKYASLGDINICRETGSTEVAFHEILHVILPPRKYVPLKNFTIRGNTFRGIYTPRALEAVRNHVNCHTIDAIPLDKKGHHWNLMFFGGSILSAKRAYNTYISPATIGALEDTGYRINHDYVKNGLSEHLIPFSYFGKNKGCNFWNKPCTEWLNDPRNEEFAAVGKENSNCGGRHRFSLDFYNNYWINETCPDENLGPVYECSISKIAELCDESSVCVLKGSNKEEARPKCFRFVCNSTDSTYTMMIEDQSMTYSCTKSSTVVHGPGRRDIVICPSYPDIEFNCRLKDNTTSPPSSKKMADGDGTSSDVEIIIGISLSIIIVILVCIAIIVYMKRFRKTEYKKPKKSISISLIATPPICKIYKGAKMVKIKSVQQKKIKC